MWIYLSLSLYIYIHTYVCICMFVYTYDIICMCIHICRCARCRSPDADGAAPGVPHALYDVRAKYYTPEITRVRLSWKMPLTSIGTFQ